MVQGAPAEVRQECDTTKSHGKSLTPADDQKTNKVMCHFRKIVIPVESLKDYVPLTDKQRHKIYDSKLEADGKVRTMLKGLLKVRKTTDPDLQSREALFWAIKNVPPSRLNLSSPTCLEAIVSASKANSKSFFIRLGRELEKNRSEESRIKKRGQYSWGSELQRFLIDGWVRIGSDLLDFNTFSEDPPKRVQSIAFCFFTDEALWLAAIYALNNPTLTFDNVAKTRGRLGLLQAPVSCVFAKHLRKYAIADPAVQRPLRKLVR
jgi:hypothetical protein